MRDNLIFDLQYGYWYNLACERCYARTDFALSFVQLVGGSGAALGVVNGSPVWVAASGVALAACAAASLLIQPAVKAYCHRQSKQAFLDLKGRAHQLDDAQLSAEVARVQAAGAAGIGALETPAFNRALHATGHTDGARPLNALERLMAFVS